MLSVLLNYTNHQDFTHFTNQTLKSPDIFGCWIKPTYISTGSEAFLSAVLRNRSAILDCILQSARPRSQAFKLFVTCLILLVGDISLNPGPFAPSICGICTKRVRDTHKGSHCDSCDIWFHTSCCSVNDSAYSNLANSTCTWICPLCDQPTFSSSLAFSRTSSSSTFNSNNSRSWPCHMTLVTIYCRAHPLCLPVHQTSEHLLIFATVPAYAVWRLTVIALRALSELPWVVMGMGGGGGCMVGAYARLGVCANKYGIFVLFKLV